VLLVCFKALFVPGDSEGTEKMSAKRAYCRLLTQSKFHLKIYTIYD